MNYQFAEINGTNIHYERRGEGTAVTFIHAGINNLNMWDDQMEAFATQYQVLRYDFRGWGETPSPPGQFYDHEDLYHLLNHLGIAKTAVVGCSGGGKIGIDFALTYPEKVTALVLVGPGLGGYKWTMDGFKEKAEAMAAAYEAGNLAEAAEQQAKIWVDGLDRPTAQVKADVRQRAYEMILHTLKLGDSDGERRELDPPAINRLSEIQAPIRILSGQYDMPDIHVICDLIEEECPRAEEQILLRDAAHLPNMERPSAFNDLVLDFLDRVSWEATIYAILPHTTEARVWLQENDEGKFSLPQITMFGSRWNTTEARVQRPLQAQLDANINVLYCAAYQEDDSAKTTESVFVLDNLGAVMKNGRWVDQATLQTISLAQPAHQPLIANSLQEWATGDVPALRPAWARRGWYAQAEQWIEDALQQLGHPLTAPLEVIRNWGLSYVLRAYTEQGVFYFKTVGDLPLFVNEAVAVRHLAKLFPENVLAPIAIEAERDWMLLPPLTHLLNWGAELEQRQGFLAQFAQMQKTAVSHVDGLIAVGCLDRRLAWTTAQIEPLFTANLTKAAIDEKEQAELLTLMPKLHEVCDKLAQGPLPQTLVHGDLHGGNVGIQNDTYIFFDWTDACITHPFFDMIDIFFEEDTAVKTELQNSYFAQWTDFAPMSELQAIWPLAELGMALHHAISYWQIIANLEAHAQSDLGDMFARWLREILRLSKNLAEK